MTTFLRRFWPLLALALIVVAVLYLLRHRETATGPVAPAVQIATVRQGTLLVRISAHGRVGPPPGSAASLAFPLAGRLNAIDVRVGDRVEQGQALARLDTEPFALMVAQARGDLEAATGTLQSATSSVAVRVAEASALANQADLKVQADRQALQRVQALYSAGIAALKDVIAAQNLLAADETDAHTAHLREQALRSGLGSSSRAANGGGQARADLLTAHGQAERARAALAEAERNLANATLRAPASGVIVAILKHPGEAVDPTTPVVTLGSVLDHSATLTVPADQARRIRLGNDVQLHIGQSSVRATGRVIALVPAVDPTTQQAIVVVNGVPTSAFAGDAVDATIIVAAENGVLVPTSAIVQDPQTGATLVFVATTDKRGQQTFEPRKVSVSAGDQTTTRIQSGLKPGEKVASEGAFELLAPAASGS